MERFFMSLKKERLWERECANHAEAMSDVAEYIVLQHAAALQTGQLSTQCLRAAIGNQSINLSRVRKGLTSTGHRLPLATVSFMALRVATRAAPVASRTMLAKWVGNAHQPRLERESASS